MHPILFRLPVPSWGEVPIYTWGVMLGVSLIVGWYLTLGLAERDGMPREMLANCYVITALAALLGARLLFVASNPESFDGIGSMFEVRSGGMVAYGGMVGGVLASAAYLRWKGFPLLPWADVAAPSIAVGLFFTRIGCYLYGCDFGTRLEPTASTTLQRLGTFPQWPEGTVEQGEGSPAWAHHVTQEWVAPGAGTSLPVHPTQLYEAAIGLALLGALLWLRRRQSFRGQVFLTLAVVYGFARFCVEFLRDDLERGAVPPALPAHVLYPLALAGFGLAITLGVAPAIRTRGARALWSAASFAPALWAAIELQPGEYGFAPSVKLSTSQFIGLASAAAAALAFRVLWKNAQAHPVAAMAIPAWTGDDAETPSAPAKEDEEEGSEPKERPDAGDSRDERPAKASKPAAKAAKPAAKAGKADADAEAEPETSEPESGAEPRSIPTDAAGSTPKPRRKTKKKKARVVE